MSNQELVQISSLPGSTPLSDPIPHFQFVEEVARKPASKPYDGRTTWTATRLQRAVGHLLLLPFGGIMVFLLRYFGRYKIENLAEIRAEYRRVTLQARKAGTPLVICANHLTFIDSALMIWAMGSLPWYLFHFRYFSWNLPAGDFFKKKFSYRLVAYLSKCLFIHRDGTKAHRDSILNLCQRLLLGGEVLTIFPEGRRSRSGRFEIERLTYGVGKIITQIGRCEVLCVYLRGEYQETYSNYPRRGSRFHVEMKNFTAQTRLRGRDAYHSITTQIGQTLHSMERNYFDQGMGRLPS